MEFDPKLSRDEVPSFMSLLLDDNLSTEQTLRLENAIEEFHKKNSSSSSSFSSPSSSSSTSPKDLFRQNFPHTVIHHHRTHQTPTNGFLPYSNNANSFSIERFSSSSSSTSSQNNPNSYFPVFQTLSTPPAIDPIQDLTRGFSSSSTTHNNTHHHHHYQFHDYLHGIQTPKYQINLNDSSSSSPPPPPPPPISNLFPTRGGGRGGDGGDGDRRGGRDRLEVLRGSLHPQQKRPLLFRDPSLERIDEDEVEQDQGTEEEQSSDDDYEASMVAMKKKGRSSVSAESPKRSVVKGQWTVKEDQLLVQLVGEHGLKNWSLIGGLLGRRAGKQCRERWNNHLRPDIKKDAWSKEEDEMLIQAHKELGSKWSEIAKRLPGRTENSIKNHWNATKRRQFPFTRRNYRSPELSASAVALKDYIHAVTDLPSPSGKNKTTRTPPPAKGKYFAGSSSSGASSASDAPATATAVMYDLNQASQPSFMFSGDGVPQFGGGFGSAMEMQGFPFADGGITNSFGMSIDGYKGGSGW